MSKFRCRNSLRFVFSVFIPYPDHLVQELVCPSAIDFRVHYPRNFILRFLVNNNWYKASCVLLGKELDMIGSSIDSER